MMRSKLPGAALCLFILTMLLCSSACVAAQGDDQSADMLFVNGNIYTVNDAQPRAQSIAVKRGKVVFVGSDADAAKYRESAARIIDLGGMTVVPGLIDAHCHLSGVGAREMTLNLEGTASLQDFLAKVKARVEDSSPGQWV